MKNKILTFLALAFLTINEVASQPTLPGTSGDGPSNVDDVPIQFLIYPLLLLGAYLGYKKIKRN
jgi:hypothetical protein